MSEELVIGKGLWSSLAFFLLLVVCYIVYMHVI